MRCANRKPDELVIKPHPHFRPNQPTDSPFGGIIPPYLKVLVVAGVFDAQNVTIPHQALGNINERFQDLP